MAVTIQEFAVTIPAGTASSTPYVANLVFPVTNVDGLQIRVPPGPNGMVGFAIGSGGTPVFPPTGQQWVITDDESIEWPLEGAWDSGAWQLIGYNTGNYPHTIYVRFLCTPVGYNAAATAGPSVIPSSVLES